MRRAAGFRRHPRRAKRIVPSPSSDGVDDNDPILAFYVFDLKWERPNARSHLNNLKARGVKVHNIAKGLYTKYGRVPESLAGFLSERAELRKIDLGTWFKQAQAKKRKEAEEQAVDAARAAVRAARAAASVAANAPGLGESL